VNPAAYSKRFKQFVIDFIFQERVPNAPTPAPPTPTPTVRPARHAGSSTRLSRESAGSSRTVSAV
jgi:hypothetical protein